MKTKTIVAILAFLVTGVDKNGFEISEEIDINVWKVLVFINIR